MNQRHWVSHSWRKGQPTGRSEYWDGRENLKKKFTDMFELLWTDFFRWTEWLTIVRLGIWSSSWIKTPSFREKVTPTEVVHADLLWRLMRFKTLSYFHLNMWAKILSMYASGRNRCKGCLRNTCHWSCLTLMRQKPKLKWSLLHANRCFHAV